MITPAIELSKVFCLNLIKKELTSSAKYELWTFNLALLQSETGNKKLNFQCKTLFFYHDQHSKMNSVVKLSHKLSCKSVFSWM